MGLLSAVLKKVAPVAAGATAATQSEDADAIFAGLLARNASKAGAKAAKEVFDEHLRISPAIFTDYEHLIQSGADQSRAAREAGNSRQGWFIGADGKPRYEINDSNASIDRSFTNDSAHNIIEMLAEKDRQNVGVPLNALLNHDSLFNAYPDLEEMPLYMWKPKSSYLGDSLGGYTRPEEDLPVGAMHINLGGILDHDRGETLKTLLHEMQHAVQQKEGFARGANQRTAIDDVKNYVTMPNKHGAVSNMSRDALVERKLGKLSELVEMSKSDDPDAVEWADILSYYMSAGETEARAVERRLRMPAGVRSSDEAHPYGDMVLPSSLTSPRNSPTLFQMIEMMTEPGT